MLLLPLVAIPFVRRYHAGEIGVRRGLQIGGLILVLAIILIAMTGSDIAQGSSTGVASRVQMTWLAAGFMLGFVLVPVAIMSVLTWSVGESLCRERYPGKLAAFDAIFQGQWRNATVARSSLRGLVLGTVLVTLMSLLGLALKSLGVREVASFLFTGWWYSSHWPGLVIVVFFSLWMLHAELFGRLFLVSLASRKVGLLAGGLVAALISGVLLHGPGVPVSSLTWWVLATTVGHALLVTIFVRYDLWTSLVAGVSSACLAFSYPLLTAADPWLQFPGRSGRSCSPPRRR